MQMMNIMACIYVMRNHITSEISMGNFSCSYSQSTLVLSEIPVQAFHYFNLETKSERRNDTVFQWINKGYGEVAFSSSDWNYYLRSFADCRCSHCAEQLMPSQNHRLG